eukprot:jgi/Mesvir1/29003/Mv17770-RA.1
MECSMRGVIKAQAVPELRALLCGFSKWGPASEVPFKSHEVVLKSAAVPGVPTTELRAICNLESAPPSWTLRQEGRKKQAEDVAKLPAAVRSVVDASVSSNIVAFLSAIGFRVDFELLKEGYLFQVPLDSHMVTVTVATVSKLSTRHQLDSAEALHPEMCLVQATSMATAEDYVEVVGVLEGLAGQIAPIIQLKKD